MRTRILVACRTCWSDSGNYWSKQLRTRNIRKNHVHTGNCVLMFEYDFWIHTCGCSCLIVSKQIIADSNIAIGYNSHVKEPLYE